MRQHLMDPCYFRCCCPRLHPFNHRQSKILRARKSQSHHHLAFEIHSLLNCISFRFLHLRHRILSFFSMFKTLRFRFEFEAISGHNSTKEKYALPHLETNSPNIPLRGLPNHTTEIPQISLALGFPVSFGLT
ncbi:UNVERIFIED_CONTAM: hypothetical protein NCL1_44024 [Trichonephila clavipes]